MIDIVKLHILDKEIIPKVEKNYLFPLVELYVENNSNIQNYYSFENSTKDSDFFILPVCINKYFKLGFKNKFYTLLEEAVLLKKSIIIFSSGDFGLTFNHKNITTVRLGGFKNKFDEKTIIMPPFVKDPIQAFNLPETYLEHSNIPTIGFVGHSDSGFLKWLKEFIIFIINNLFIYFKIMHADYQKFYPSSIRRRKYLKFIENISTIKSNFIHRKKYRAGIKTKVENIITSLEFYNNILENQYTFCMRGGGNFSVRFYETLALGRIPILLNTHCKLPFENIINWNNHIVIINEKDYKETESKILNFNNKHNTNSFINLQKENRILWKEFLNKEVFFIQLSIVLKLMKI